MSVIRLSPRPNGQFAVVKFEHGVRHVMGTGGYREEALFPSRRSAWTAFRIREERGTSSWIRQDPFDGLPTVGTGRPGSMFGGLKEAGRQREKLSALSCTGTGRISSTQPQYQEVPRVTTGKYDDWRDVEAEDPIPVHALVLAFRAAIDGLTESPPNEEAMLSGVPVVAFQH